MGGGIASGAGVRWLSEPVKLGADALERVLFDCTESSFPQGCALPAGSKQGLLLAESSILNR